MKYPNLRRITFELHPNKFFEKLISRNKRRSKMRALVVDDTLVCLNLTGEVLAKEGWDSELVHITDVNRESFRMEDLDGKIPVSISDIDLVVSDLELGGGVAAWGFILAIRKQYPNVPVVLLTGAEIDFELWDELEKAGIDFVRKQQFNRDVAPVAGERKLKHLIAGSSSCGGKTRVHVPDGYSIIPADDPAWHDKYYLAEDEPRLEEKLPPLWSELSATVSDLSNVWNKVKDWMPKNRNEARVKSLKKLKEICRLANSNVSDAGYNSIYSPGPLTHTIGHLLCDGILQSEDIKPLMPALKKVLERIEDWVKKDERFRQCSDFILAGGPVENLPLILGAY